MAPGSMLALAAGQPGRVLAWMRSRGCLFFKTGLCFGVGLPWPPLDLRMCTTLDLHKSTTNRYRASIISVREDNMLVVRWDDGDPRDCIKSLPQLRRYSRPPGLLSSCPPVPLPSSQPVKPVQSVGTEDTEEKWEGKALEKKVTRCLECKSKHRSLRSPP